MRTAGIRNNDLKIYLFWFVAEVSAHKLMNLIAAFSKELCFFLRKTQI